MPFLLRRTKDEVLSDLPEKIIQDRFCDLSPVQLKLYERFSGSHVRQEISSMVKSNESEVPQESSGSTKASSHIFQVCFLFSILVFNTVSLMHILFSFLRHSSICLNFVVILCLLREKKCQIR